MENDGVSSELTGLAGGHYRINGEAVYLPPFDDGVASERFALRLRDGSICGHGRLYWGEDGRVSVQASWDSETLDRVYAEGGPYLTLEYGVR